MNGNCMLFVAITKTFHCVCHFIRHWEMIMEDYSKTEKHFFSMLGSVEQWNNWVYLGLLRVGGSFRKTLADKVCSFRHYQVSLSLCSINNEDQSPFLSFNSIFTSCQTHLGAFHHLCSPSTIFSSMGFSLPVNVWWTALWGSVWGLKVPLSHLFLWIFFFLISTLCWCLRHLLKHSASFRDSCLRDSLFSSLKVNLA